MARMAKLGDARELSSRIRFVVRDVIDMKRNKWCAAAARARLRARTACCRCTVF